MSQKIPYEMLTSSEPRTSDQSTVSYLAKFGISEFFQVGLGKISQMVDFCFAFLTRRWQFNEDWKMITYVRNKHTAAIF